MSEQKQKLDSSSHNFKFWQTEARARKFKVMRGLQPQERAIFDWLKGEYEQPSILDLGVGAGRTTEGLLDVSSNYTGLDYSGVMVGICKERYPETNFVVGDARNLVDFQPDSLDVVVFSYNGIDCVGPNDRKEILKEVKRVLKPSGVFIHSSHNLNYRLLSEIRNPFARVHLGNTLHPVKLFKNIYKYFVGIFAHRRLKKEQIFGEGWAVLNEQTNRFRELMYYVTPARQIEQLQEIGLSVVNVYGMDGTVLDEPADSEDGWVYYVSTVLRT